MSIRTPKKRCLKQQLETITMEDILKQECFINLDCLEKIRQLKIIMCDTRLCLSKNPKDVMAKMILNLRYLQLQKYMQIACEQNLIKWTTP